MDLRIGAHTGNLDPVAEATARGADLVQFFIGDPQDWKGHEVAYAEGPAALKAAAERSGIALYVHAPYLINVASTNNRIRIPSRKMLQVQMDKAAEIGAAGVIVHGGHVLAADDPAKGFDNWRKAVDQLDTHGVPLLVENTAGGDNAMSRELDRISGLWEAIGQADGGDEVGFTLDTCHAHAAGIDLSTAVDDIRSRIGRIDLVHCNDSRDPAGSGADRHTSLGQGQIPPEDLVGVVRAAGVPVVCETPGGAEKHTADFEWLRERL